MSKRGGEGAAGAALRAQYQQPPALQGRYGAQAGSKREAWIALAVGLLFLAVWVCFSVSSPTYGQAKGLEQRIELTAATGGRARKKGPAVNQGSSSSSDSDATMEVTLSVPARLVTREDQYLCTAIPAPAGYNTITHFTPMADKGVVHHMVLQACPQAPRPKRPVAMSSQGAQGAGEGSQALVWDCIEEPVCPTAEDEQDWSGGAYLYAWANGAGPFETGFPEAGFAVGSQPGVAAGHLVLQAHFLHSDAAASAAMVLGLHRGQPLKFLSVALFANSGFRLAPGLREAAAGVTCCVPGEGSAEVFAYRVHAHEYSRNISLAVRDHRTTAAASWGNEGGGHGASGAAAVVSGDPQRPHFFKKVGSDALKLKKGQDWQVTCSYDTTEAKETIVVGHGHHHEMCNLYLMLASRVPLAAQCLTWEEEEEIPAPPLHIAQPNTVIGGVGEEGEYFRNGGGTYGAGDAEEARVLGLAERVKVFEPAGMGQVGGLHLGLGGDYRRMFVFHRGKRTMGERDHASAMAEDMFAVWDVGGSNTSLGDNGAGAFGKGFDFRLPHGVTIDRDDNIWLTDVDTQMVYKMDATGSKVLLAVGQLGKRASGLRGWEQDPAFCRPTEVAVANNGVFYVADGYCESRVLKFDASGHFLKEFPLRAPFAAVPHSLVLDECRHLIYVADRENALVRVLDAETGSEQYSIDLGARGYGPVYSLARDEVGTIYALCWADSRGENGIEDARTIVVQLPFSSPSLGGRLGVGAALEMPGVNFPHDFSVSYSFRDHAVHFFVGEVGPGARGKVTLFRHSL